MNWVKKHKLPAIEAIKYNEQPYLDLVNLWQALHTLFNSAQNCQINMDLLEKILNKPVTQWTPFSVKEFKSSISKYNNTSTPGPDKLSWRHLKVIINNNSCLKSFINIANACIDLEYWPSYFKMLTSIIISKPNKVSYNIPKTFRPITLLNMLGKLIEKVTGKRL